MEIAPTLGRRSGSSHLRCLETGLFYSSLTPMAQCLTRIPACYDAPSPSTSGNLHPLCRGLVADDILRPFHPFRTAALGFDRVLSSRRADMCGERHPPTRPWAETTDPDDGRKTPSTTRWLWGAGRYGPLHPARPAERSGLASFRLAEGAISALRTRRICANALTVSAGRREATQSAGTTS